MKRNQYSSHLASSHFIGNIRLGLVIICLKLLSTKKRNSKPTTTAAAAASKILLYYDGVQRRSSFKYHSTG
jgi:hypothetical protein